MSAHPSLLITAFESFGSWPANSSQLCLARLAGESFAGRVAFCTLPVDFAAARPVLEAQLAVEYDLAIHIGQAQQTGRIRLEAVAINVGGVPGQPPEEFLPLVESGPVAYRTPLPLPSLALRLREAGIPAYVSYHAGTYLCNAVFYWSQHAIAERGLRTRCCFIHLPLDVSQVVADPHDWPTLPTPLAARAVRLAVETFSSPLDTISPTL